MIKNFDDLIDEVQSTGIHRVSVAAAEDKELLLAIKAAMELGFIHPILVGNEVEIKKIAEEIGLPEVEIIHSSTPEESAQVAVRLVKEKRASVLMKGLVNTSTYMRALLNRENGLRTGKLISLMAVYQLPGYHKLLYCTDSGVNVSPNLDQKKAILNNVLEAMANIGVTNPKAAALTANENVDPKMLATTDAKGLVDYVNSGATLPCIIEGPIAFDVAFDPHAAAHKGMDSKISGDVDLLVFPNIEAGNILGKSWLYFNQAKWAGIVLGASSPVILGSRSDTAEIKINSIALACLAAGKEK